MTGHGQVNRFSGSISGRNTSTSAIHSHRRSFTTPFGSTIGSISVFGMLKICWLNPISMPG